MPNHTGFRLNRSGLLVALISAAFAGDAGAVAGRVDFATAGATIAGRDGQPRPLAKGAELDSGDTVRTDTAGRAQIRFTDGSYVSLQPNTEFAIKDYNFEGKTDGSERGIFGLAKGAMRTVTGLIGRVNRNKYQITTPTATVGIRGTGGRIEVLLDGSTIVAGTSGIWTLSNPAGTIDVPAGTSGKAPANPDQPPQQTTEQPKNDPAPPPPVFRQGENLNNNPVIDTLPPVANGSGFAVASAFATSAGFFVARSLALDTTSTSLGIPLGGIPVAIAAFDADVTFDASGRFTGYSASSGAISANLLPDAVSPGVHAEANNMDGLAWGRWTGSVQNCLSSSCSTDVYSPNQGFHYVIGTPTPVMPTSGKGTYVLMGATSPTYTDGRTTPGKFTGSLEATFTPTGTNVGVNLNISMPDNRSYAIGGSTGPMSGAFFSGVAAAVPDPAKAGTFTQFQSSTLTILPGAGAAAGTCGTSCVANLQGFFAGPKAERAGLSYQIQDSGPVTIQTSLNNQSANIVGAAAFKKSP